MEKYGEKAMNAEDKKKKIGPERDGMLAQSKMFLHLPSEFAKKSLVYASYVGQCFCNSTYRNEQTSFDYYLLICVDSGRLYVEYEEAHFELTAGEVLLLDCRKQHIYGARENSSFRYLYFRGGSSHEYYRLLAGKRGYFTRPAHSVEVQSALHSIFALISNTVYDEHRISVQIYRILAEWAADGEKQEAEQNDAVLRAIAFMEHHFAERLTIEQIADSVNLSEYYFSRLFRRCTAISPHAYLVNLRITMARQLLTVTQKSVDRIAEETGFHSTTNFIRSFREHVGCTPKQYRRNIQHEKTDSDK